MKALIIEDEAVAANRLEKQLDEVAPEIKVLAKIGSIKDAVKWLTVNSSDLIFLDIQLSDGISFSIFEQVSIDTPVIFTTAYDQYSIKAFELNSIAYLLKPIRKKDLSESLQKLQKLKSAFSIDFGQLLAEMQGAKPEYKKRFVIQIGNKIKMVETADVAFFYAMEKSVFMKTFGGSSYPLEFSLDKLENLIDSSKFFRINRKYLVNMDAIESMTAWSRSRVKLKMNPAADDEMETIVSVDRSPEFKEWLNK